MADITGTENKDTLVGTAADDFIRGLGGNDVISGGDGNDRLEGGEGNDTLNGEYGDDIVYGGGGNDVINDEREGNAQLFGDDGDDSIFIIRDGLAATSVTVLADGGAGDDFIDIFDISSPYPNGVVSVILVGGLGDDRIFANAINGGTTVTIDGGAGSDRVEVINRGAITVTLGADIDRLVIKSLIPGPGPSVKVTDLTPGVDGDHLDLSIYSFTGWDGFSNLFASNYLRLVQVGADAVLQADTDGAAGPANFADIAVFQGANSASFTARNLGGFSPNGAAPSAETFVGTNARDVLIGNAGNDLIQGLGGNDLIEGGFGDDRLEGGDGSDALDGGKGNDLLFGGNDADRLTDFLGGNDELRGEGGDDFLQIDRAGSQGTTAILDGGDGRDTIGFGSSPTTNQAQIFGGADNDRITVTGGAVVTVDAGSGDDRVTVFNRDTSCTITLGSGTDTFLLRRFPGFVTGSVTITDLATGNGGDQIALLPYLEFVLQGWDRITNPFASGHLRLVQSGGDTLVQVDRDAGGTGSTFINLVVLQNVTASSLTGFNLGSFSPDGSAPVGQTFVGTEAADGLTGYLGSDLIRGLAEDDILSGRAGDDQIEGGAGDDTISGDEGNDILDGGTGNDVLSGGAGNDRIDGGGGVDSMDGGAGNDQFAFSSVGFSQPTPIGLIDGGADDDTIDFRNISPVILGTIEVSPGVFALGAYVGSQRFEIRNVEHILFGGSDDSIGVPPSFSQVIELRGGGGKDSFTVSAPVSAYGEDGDDSFFVSGKFGGPAVSGVVDGGAGIDLLKLNISFTVDLAAGTAVSGVASFAVSGIERVQAAAVSGYATTIRGSDAAETFEINPLFNDGSVGMVFEGRGGADTLRGSKGNDTLDGSAGADLLEGGDGNDRLIGGLGADAASYQSAAAAVTVRLGVTEAQNTVGAGSDTLDGFEQLIGSSFGDALYGDGLGNLLSGGAGDDYLDGAAGDDALYGDGDNDVLIGGAGADLMAGGAGNDQYLVDSALDQVVELVGGGTHDIVFAQTSFALTSGQEVEELAAADAASTQRLDLTGNEVANRLYGNAGVNILIGGAGADLMAGFGGDDYYFVDEAGDRVLENAGGGDDLVFTTASFAIASGQEVEELAAAIPSATTRLDLTGNEFGNRLYGSDGLNVIVGGGGADIMAGFGGNDQYLVDEIGDRVLESVGGGDDIVFATASFALTSGQEVEELSAAVTAGTTRLDLTGNEFANRLYGNAGVNVLIGGGGADLMNGFGGDDQYQVDNGGDQVAELAGGGHDIVFAIADYTLAAGVQAEELAAVSGAGSLNLFGNELANAVYGNASVNVLAGREGDDIMAGFGGADFFVFDTALSTGGVDRILDFEAGIDQLALDDTAFGGLAGVNASNFVTSQTGAQDSDDRIIYDSAFGALFFDADGNGAGAAVLFALVTPGLALNAGDFVVI